jgi:PAS domain S-box-containing protein
MVSHTDFSSALHAAMARPTYRVTPGLLGKLSGVPKATIVNWLEGRVRRPRTPGALHAVCDALRLSIDEARSLYAAAEIPFDPPWPMRFDRIPVGLYATTVDGRILFANETLVEMLGYPSLDEYLRVSVRELYAEPAHRDGWLERMDRAGTLHRVPVRARRADRSTVELLDSATAIRDGAGTITHFEGVWEFATRPLD